MEPDCGGHTDVERLEKFGELDWNASWQKAPKFRRRIT
jgi:hypothetical protein